MAGARLGVAGHVEGEHPQATPTCGAASPTQPGAARWVAEQVGGQRDDGRVERVDLGRAARQHRRRRAARRRGPTLGQGRQEAHSASQHVGVEHAQRHLDARVRQPTAARSRLSCSGSTAAGQVDLGEQHVELAGEPGRQVGDVAAGLGHDAGHRRDDARPVGAVDREQVRRAEPGRPARSRGISRTETTSEPSAVSEASAASASAAVTSAVATTTIAK